VIPEIPGREHAITSDDLLFLPDFPSTLTLFGAGAIALEMASAFRDLGSEVTVIGREAEILPGFDAEVAGYLRTILEAKGVAFQLDARVARLDGRPGAITAWLEDGSTVTSAVTCLAAGRQFHPRMLGGEDGGYLELVFDGATQRLRGAQIVSYAAAELIHLCALAIRTGASADAVAAQISVHPSHGERLLKAFGADLRDFCEP